MPQSVNVRQSEIHNQPEHAAESAATHTAKVPQPLAHDETVQAEDHVDKGVEREAKLHHGKEAALEAARQKK